jgi:DNA-binding transcriptional LysR family regulator
MRLKISLDYWQALVAVVEEGSYARAAEALNKSQSTVNYAIGKLEELLDIQVFERVGRRSEPTPAGRALYQQGRFLLRQAEQVEERAGFLAAGWEPQLNLAAEIIFPPTLLLQCLQAFSAEPAAPPVEVFESVLGGTEELLREGEVDLAICSGIPDGFMGDTLMQVEFIAVAAPTHPLHQLNRELNMDDLRKHRQLVIRDSGRKRTPRVSSVISESRWTVSHISTSIRAACMGLGFAWFPKDSIQSQLASCELRPLPLQQGSRYWASLYLVYADVNAAGPAALKLGKIIREAAVKTS